MEIIFSEPNEEKNFQSEEEIQKIIDESFPPTLKEKVIDNILKNSLTIHSNNADLNTTIDLSPKNFLGKGLYGLVMSAFTEKYGKIAFKLFTSKESLSNEAVREEFNSEMEILDDLHHPNIAACYGAADIEVTKSSVIKAIAREIIPIEFHPVEVGEAVQLAVGIAAAMDYLNEKKGAIMADPSPENFRQRNDGTWAIVDIGHLARPSDSRPRTISIDEKYTAPEIKFAKKEDQNKLATPASEVYSLALIVWKGLSGVDNDPIDTSLTFKRSDEFPQPLMHVLQKATSLKQEDRYTTPSEFAEALKVAAFPQPLVNL